MKNRKKIAKKTKNTLNLAINNAIVVGKMLFSFPYKKKMYYFLWIEAMAKRIRSGLRQL